MRNKPKYLIAVKDNIKIVAAIVVSIIFLSVSLIMTKTGPTLFLLIPPVLLLILLAFLAIDKFLFLTVLFVPVSIQLRFIIPDISADIFIPTEPMLAGILILMIFKVLNKGEINKKLLIHPVSIISFCMLGWYLITSLTGTLPLVSLKSFITRLWFFTGFYLLAAEIFTKPEKIRIYFYAYISGLVPVLFYYLFRMWQAGIFNQQIAHTAIRPFFNDHTSFGASLAFCIPMIIYLLTSRERSKRFKTVLSVLLIVFSAAFVFSYSRAAWLSLAVAAIVVLFLFLRISWKIVIPAIVLVFIIFSLSWPGILMRLNENKQESSASLKRHLQSIANIRSDVSNMERMNRWKSALRMFKEKPVMGWGPATYQFKYAPFQMASEKTIISTNYGEGGNAHSEYLGSLVDSGIPGMIMYILLLSISIWKGIIIWRTHSNKQIRNIALALIAGLVTYAVHGVFNNFLDTDKISALFWGVIAAIVAIDISMKDEKEPQKLSSQVSGNN
jgi:putative inorganic carbon (hco3(-)) transporter